VVRRRGGRSSDGRLLHDNQAVAELCMTSVSDASLVRLRPSERKMGP